MQHCNVIFFSNKIPSAVTVMFSFCSFSILGSEGNAAEFSAKGVGCIKV